jgi:hypothetical protein
MVAETLGRSRAAWDSWRRCEKSKAPLKRSLDGPPALSKQDIDRFLDAFDEFKKSKA